MLVLGVLLPLLLTGAAATETRGKYLATRKEPVNGPKPLSLKPLHMAHANVDPSKARNQLEYLYGGIEDKDAIDARVKFDLNAEVIPLDADQLGYDVNCDDKRRSDAPLRLHIRFADHADHHGILDSWAAKARKVKRSTENADVVFACKVKSKCVPEGTNSRIAKPEGADDGADQLTFLRVPAGEVAETIEKHSRMLKRGEKSDKTVGFEAGIAAYEDIIDDVTITVGEEGHLHELAKRQVVRENGTDVVDNRGGSADPRPIHPDGHVKPDRFIRVYLSIKGFIKGSIKKVKNFFKNLFDFSDPVMKPEDIKSRTFDFEWRPENTPSTSFPGYDSFTMIPRLTDSMEIECLDCYAYGRQTYSLWIHFSLRNPLKPFDMKFWMDGEMELNVQAGMIFFGRLEAVKRIGMPEINLLGLFIPGIFSFGPMLSIEYENGVQVEYESKSVMGLNMKWERQQVCFELSPSNPGGERLEYNGLSPVTTTTYQIMGMKGSADVFTGISFNMKFGISILGGLVGMYDMRLSNRHVTRFGVSRVFDNIEWAAEREADGKNATWESPTDLIPTNPDCKGWWVNAGFRSELFLETTYLFRKTFWRKDYPAGGYCIPDAQQPLRIEDGPKHH